jgi:hypothetical protein
MKDRVLNCLECANLRTHPEPTQPFHMWRCVANGLTVGPTVMNCVQFKRTKEASPPPATWSPPVEHHNDPDVTREHNTYQRLRRYMATGGEIVKDHVGGAVGVSWRSACRNGRRFDGAVTSRFIGRSRFVFNKAEYRISEGPVGTFHAQKVNNDDAPTQPVL